MSFKFIPLQFSLSQCFGLWLVVVSPKISRKLVFLPINLNKFVLLEVDTWKRSICETISHRILMFNVFHYKFNNQLKNIFCLHFQPFTVWYTTMLISEFHIKNILKKEKISRLIRTIRMICISASCKNLEYSLNNLLLLYTTTNVVCCDDICSLL